MFANSVKLQKTRNINLAEISRSTVYIDFIIILHFILTVYVLVYLCVHVLLSMCMHACVSVSACGYYTLSFHYYVVL